MIFAGETVASTLLFQDALRQPVESATGWSGLLMILAYSLLVATVLPMPVPLVLLAPLDLGVTLYTRLGIIVVVSAVGTTLGSLMPFFSGNRSSRSP